MNIYNISKTMSREDFLNNEEYTDSNGCPFHCGVIGIEEECIGKCSTRTCKECWEKELRKIDIKFKGEDDMVKTNIDKQRELFQALKQAKNLCNQLDCEGCMLHNNIENECMLKIDNVKVFKPDFIKKINKIESRLNDLNKVKIYKVEHCLNGKLYKFISEDDLNVGDFVVCDTIKGRTYGVVKEIEICENNNYKKCERV